MTEQEEIIRGEEAKQLLAHPLLKAAFAECKSGLIRSMESSPMSDSALHNRFVIALQLLAQIEKSIRDHVTTGEMAQISVQDSLRQRIRRAANW